MTNTHQDNDETFQRFNDELRQARDELRVKLHLAAMDARTAWDRFEPRLREIEQQAQTAVANLHTQLRQLRQELARPDGTP